VYGKVSKPGGYSMPRKVEKPYNGGQWTVARKKSFIISALRKARWPVKYQVLKDAYVTDGINPKTGRKCKLYRCAMCRGLFMQKEMAVDHILPIVDPEVGFVDYNTWIERCFVEADGFQVLCKNPCHKEKTDKEKAIAKERRKK